MVSDANTPYGLRAQPGQQAARDQETQQRLLDEGRSGFLAAMRAQPHQLTEVSNPHTPNSTNEALRMTRMAGLVQLLGGATVYSVGDGGTSITNQGDTLLANWGNEPHPTAIGLDTGELEDAMKEFDTGEDTMGEINIGWYDADEEDNADESLGDAPVETGARDTWVWRLVGAVTVGAVAYAVYKRAVRSGA